MQINGGVAVAKDFRIADAVLHGPEFPRMVSITTTSRCNLRCVMCHHGIRNVKKQDFDLELVERFDDLFEKASLITLTGLGEALLSDSFWEVLRLGRETNDGQRPHIFSFNTNGTLLTEKNVDLLLESRVKKIRVSIDSTDPVMKKKIRGADLGTILQGTRRLIDTRNARGYTFPLVGIEMTLMKDTAHEVDAMIDLAVDLGVDFLEVWPLNVMNQKTAENWTVEKEDWTFNYLEQMVSSLPDDKGRQKEREYLDQAATKGLAMVSRLSGVPISNSLMAELNSRAGFDGLQESDGFNDDTVPVPWTEKSIRCDLPWKQLRTTYEGDAFNCCWGRGSIGSLREQSATAVWHGEKQKAMREMLIEGIVPSFCATSPCPFVRGKTEELTNDISIKHYFNFTPYGNGLAVEGQGWEKGDDWGISADAKRAGLVFTRSELLKNRGLIRFTLRSDDADSFKLTVAVNGKRRAHVTLGGEKAGQVATVDVDFDENDFRFNGSMEIFFEGLSHWASPFLKIRRSFILHSAHILERSEEVHDKPRGERSEGQLASAP